MKSLLITMVVGFMVVPASAQVFCDVNGDSAFTGSDINSMIYMLGSSPDLRSACGINCDVDEDGEAMTIADMGLVLFAIYFPDLDPPYFSYNPMDDTAKITSAEVSPGDQISLPVYLTTADTLAAFEFLIMVDNQYLTIENFIPDQNPLLYYPFSASLLHINYIGFVIYEQPVYYYPGNYHLGDLVLNVNPDIVEPVSTNITFGTCPDDNFYTGLANMTFFVPVLVDGVVTITPVGIEEDEPSLPLAVSIDAYPNPFNMSVKIVVESPVRDVLSIYDILGREIYSIEVDAGINFITWNSLDYDNDQVNAGIYFAKLRRSSSDVKKLLLMK
jgi:hypothetical protein